MTIKFSGTAKELAAFALALQAQQVEPEREPKGNESRITSGSIPAELIPFISAEI